MQDVHVVRRSIHAPLDVLRQAPREVFRRLDRCGCALLQVMVLVVILQRRRHLVRVKGLELGLG